MPEIGEVSSGHKIGLKDTGKFIWLACQLCGKGRWVRSRGRRHTICIFCKQKILVENQRKEKHPNWTGGYQEMRRRKRERIITTCPSCGKEIGTSHESMQRWLRKYKGTTSYQPLCISCSSSQVNTGRVAWNKGIHNWWTTEHRENHLSAIWVNGTSFEPYDSNFNEGLKEQVRQRDNYTCQLCGIPQNGRKHDIHHIDYNKKHSISDNLITLCLACHRTKTRDNRDYWQAYFTELLVKRGIITSVQN